MEAYKNEVNEAENLEDEEEKNIFLQEPLSLDNINFFNSDYLSDP